MSFQSGGFAYGGGVVQQRCQGGWVWAQRMARGHHNPAPTCVCIPMQSKAHALAAYWLLRRQGWQCWARPGKRTGAVAEIKLVLPVGLPLAQARQALAWLCHV